MAEPVSAAVLQAVAHPLRLALLVALDAADRTPAELAATLATPPATLAPHLARLRETGLITDAATPNHLTVTTRGWTEIATRLGTLQDGRPTGVDGR
jgi:predicted transcriptional regulator